MTRGGCWRSWKRGMIDLNPNHLVTVEGILAEHVPECEVRAFGSRATWTAKDYSDLDLAVVGGGPLDMGRLGRLREAFQESDLPMRVEALDWHAVSQGFRDVIERGYVVVQKGAGEWREVALGGIAEINEATYSPKEGWPFVNYLDTGNITENHISEIQHLVTGTDKIPSRARRKVKQGDIVYSTVRPNQRHFGLIKEVPENFLASTGFAVIRGKADVACTDFIYWFLAQDHVVDYLHSIAENSTSAYPSIKPGDLEQLVLPMPPLAEQRAIAHALGTLDDKIELNRRMNETLEGMARALFESWFVDFDPVRAKMEGRDTGLPADVAALFPGRLVESELGEIPEGWGVGTLDGMIELLSGGTPKTSVVEYWDGDILWYTAKDAPNLSDVFVLETERTITQAGIENSAARVLPVGTTTITARGTVGRLACLGIPMAMNQTCYGIRGAHGYPDFFTYWNVRTAVDELQQRTHGTIFDTITRQTFTLIEMATPPVELAKAFESTLGPVMGRIRGNLQESRTLTILRDALLPRLVSGEVRVGEVNRPATRSA